MTTRAGRRGMRFPLAARLRITDWYSSSESVFGVGDLKGASSEEVGLVDLIGENPYPGSPAARASA
jgi:hypothetical protein